jgi:hypothetical protein
MKRILTLIGLFVLASGTLVVAQAPPTDPDAKGTVSISVKDNKNGVVVVTATRTAVNGYMPGSVQVFAVPQSGGRVYNALVAFAPDVEGQPPAATGEATLNLPNADYDLWGNHGLAAVPPSPAASNVGSALVQVTVTNSNTPAPESGGGMVMTVTRVTAESFDASGTYSPSANHTVDDSKVPFYTIPTGGGVIRALNATKLELKGGKYDWKTNPNVLYVPSALKYNALAVIKVKKNDGSNGHLLGTEWAKNK